MRPDATAATRRHSIGLPRREETGRDVRRYRAPPASRRELCRYSISGQLCRRVSWYSQSSCHPLPDSCMGAEPFSFPTHWLDLAGRHSGPTFGMCSACGASGTASPPPSNLSRGRVSPGGALPAPPTDELPAAGGRNGARLSPPPPPPPQPPPPQQQQQQQQLREMGASCPARPAYLRAQTSRDRCAAVW